MSDKVYVLIKYEYNKWVKDKNSDLVDGSILLYAVEAHSYNDDSTLTTYPLLDGTSVADHIYRNPITMDISGAISEGGYNNSFQCSTGESTIKEFQKLLANLKNNGATCTISKVVQNGENTSRFFEKYNMVLTSIKGTENINSFEYTLSFTQSFVGYSEYDEVDAEQLTDIYLPSLQELKEVNIDNLLFDTNKITNAIITGLTNNTNSYNKAISSFEFRIANGVKKSFFNKIKNKNILDTLEVLRYVSSISTNDINEYYTQRYIQDGKDEGYIEEDEEYSLSVADKEKIKTDTKSFYAMFNKLKSEISSRLSSFFGSSVFAYKLSSNEPHYCYATVDNNDFVFTINKNSATQEYTMKASLYANNVTLNSAYNIKNAPINISDCNNSNCIFCPNGGKTNCWAYLVYCPVYSQGGEASSRDDLTRYMIIVSKIDFSSFNDALVNTIGKILLES